MEQEQQIALAVSPWVGGTPRGGWGGKAHLGIEPSQGQQGQSRQESSLSTRCGCQRGMGSDGILHPHKEVPWQLQRPRLRSFLRDFVLSAPTAALPFGSALPREAAG